MADHQKPWELYDLRTDRSETHNLAAQHPGKVQELKQVWTRHLDEFEALVSQE